MDLDNIPPLHISVAGPVILGQKNASLGLHEDNFRIAGLQHYSDYGSHLDANNFATPSQNIYQGSGDSDCGDRNFSKSVSPRTNCSNMPLRILGGIDEDRTLDRVHSGRFQMRKIGTLHVVVRNSAVNFHQTENVDDFNKRSLLGLLTLSNEMPEKVHHSERPKYSEASIEQNIQPHLSSAQRFENFIQRCNHKRSHMYKFLSKVQHATKAERNFVKSLHRRYSENKLDYFSGNQCLGSGDSGSAEDQYIPRPPKIGKVYVELQHHQKAWIEALQVWHDCRNMMSFEVMELFLELQKNIEKLQWKMILYTQQLIEARLQSLSSFAVFACKDDSDMSWMDILGSSCIKRLCKLIEAYNNTLRKALEAKKRNKDCKNLSYESRSSSPLYYKQGLGFVDQSKFSIWSTDFVTSPQAFTASRIMALLAGPAKRSLAACLHQILSFSRSGSSPSARNYDNDSPLRNTNKLHSTQLDWGSVDDVELDEDDIITHVCGIRVMQIFDSKMTTVALNSVKKLMLSNGRFIVTFMNCLAGNTTLLRGRVGGGMRTPRSPHPSQMFVDDTQSAMDSDDDASSIASSLFTGRSSAMRLTPSSGGGKKTVLWRDSWDKDAVAELAKAYMASLVLESPTAVLMSHVVTSRNAWSNKSSDTPHRRGNSVFRPRFSDDAQVFVANATVTNMTAFEVCPRDLLAQLQNVVQALIVSKAIVQWDVSMCWALAIGDGDKCGALPSAQLRGKRVQLAKTTWTYTEALYALMHILHNYHESEEVAQLALPRLESTLDSAYRWIQTKIQQFLASWSLRLLMQICLGDLSHLTVLALKCLPMVEKCHNHVESRRSENPATLHLATHYMHNVDNIITNMQSLSGECMQMYKTKCQNQTQKTVNLTFPPHKFWRQKKLTDHTAASEYIEKCASAILAPVCDAVSVLDTRSQLMAIPPVVTSLLVAIVRCIVRNKVRFSHHGSLQLQRDFDFVVEFVCSDDLRPEVAHHIPLLNAVERCKWMTSVLQRTDGDSTGAASKSSAGYQTSSKRHTFVGKTRRIDIIDDNCGEQEDDKWMPSEREILAMRLSNNSAAGRKFLPSNWFSLPCHDQATDET